MADDSEYDESDKDVGFLYKTMRNRDPRKRKVKPVQKHLMQVNFGIDDSDDSDFEIHSSDVSDDEQENGDLIDDDVDDSGTYKDNEKHSESQSESKLQYTEKLADANNSCSSETVDDIEDEDDTEDNSDDDGVDDESEEEDKVVGRKKRNLYDIINTDDDEDDEDYVPRKKQKHSNTNNHLEKERMRSPDVIKETEKPDGGSGKCQPLKVLICCVCLGDNSETDDEIVECDNCGVAVHEGCYGISDTQSTASSESSASTEPWFCDACKAGVKPDCELCPNEGGIFKETDAGKWVHLVCALYTPGVAFGDVDKLSPVTLFEMPYSKWGLRECSLCEDCRFARTGVCISCDAGMCRSFFHVSCAQRNGLLSEASPDEDIADPFYAYCKLHAEKNTSRAKRKNYLAIQSHVRQHTTIGIQDEKEKMRFKRKLVWHRLKYNMAKAQRPPAWIPPQKLIRYLTSSPSAVKKMLRKAELMGIITQTHHVVHNHEKQERKKSHIGPALTSEFVTYYLDRNIKIEKLKADLKDLEKQHQKLRKQDNAVREVYDELLKDSPGKPQDSSNRLRREGEKLWSMLNDFAAEPLPLPEVFRAKKNLRSPSRKKEVPKSLQATVINHCGICCKSHDQHMLARCDKCHQWYHLGCLNPPLTRMPKKTNHCEWQCSKCADAESDASEGSDTVDLDAPRRLREKIKEPAKLSRAQQDMEFLFPNMHSRRDRMKRQLTSTSLEKKNNIKVSNERCTTLKRSRHIEDDKDYVEVDDNGKNPDKLDVIQSSPEVLCVSDDDDNVDVDENDDDDNNVDYIVDNCDNNEDDSSMEVDIKIIEETTPIHKQMAHFHDVSRTGRKIIKKKHYDDDESEESDTLQSVSGKRPTPDMERTRRSSASKLPPEKLFGSHCVTCSKPGDRKNMVSCDNCEQCYHFQCLDPPSKKTPKQCGYTWFCEACDVSDDES